MVILFWLHGLICHPRGILMPRKIPPGNGPASLDRICEEMQSAPGPVRIQGASKYLSVDWSRPNAEIAEKLRVSIASVSNARRRYSPSTVDRLTRQEICIKAGHARMLKMTPEQRSAVARTAGLASFKKRGSKEMSALGRCGGSSTSEAKRLAGKANAAKANAAAKAARASGDKGSG